MLDDDHDGLPDAVEDSSTVPTVGGAWKDPDDQLLPDLHAMQASSGHKDMFVEIGAMKTTRPEVYGSATAPYDSAANPIVLSAASPQHDHMPPPEVLKMVGDAYKKSPILNARQFRQGFACISMSDLISPPITQVRFKLSHNRPARPCPADAYIVQHNPAGESTSSRRHAIPWQATPCQFPAFRGTVGWRFGYRALRDAPVGDNGEELTLARYHSGSRSPQVWRNDELYAAGADSIRSGVPLFHYLVVRACARQAKVASVFDKRSPGAVPQRHFVRATPR